MKIINTSLKYTMKKLGTIRLITLMLVAMAVAPIMQGAGINKGFFKKAAKKVWAMPAEGIFNRATPIADSVAAGQSGVIIARHDHFDVSRDEQNTIYDETGRTNRTVVHHTSRSMVKLLDQSAIDRYSDFEFGGTAVRRDYGSSLDAKIETAFGARVHKADGSVVEIDPSTALEVSDGKKGDKNKKFKIAIPSLQKGDVLEYFYYTEYTKERGDVCGLDVELSDRYPVLSHLVTGEFDPTLSSEFYSYNGAPEMTVSRGKDDYTARMTVNGMPAVSFDKFVYDERQLPFVRLNVINNHQLTEENNFYATTSRRGGVYTGIKSPLIYLEAKEYMAHLAYILWKSTKPISPLPSRAQKMVKTYAKDHPGATKRQLADAAYLALRYCNHVADEEDKLGSSFLMAMLLNDVFEGLDIYAPENTGIGIVNSRSEVPTDELSGWDQSNFMACAGDSVYMMFPGFNIAPGELPGEFQGEAGKRFPGRLRETTKATPILDFTVPDRKYSGNHVKANLTVNINAENPEVLDVDRKVTLSGSCKSFGEDLVDRAEWIQGVEKFFGLTKNYKIKGYDAEARKKELREALKEECAEVSGFKPDSVISYTIDQRGFLPGEDMMKYSSLSHVSGLVEDLGDDISITLGRLLGHVAKIEDNERERLLDAMLPTAYQHTHLLTLKVPEGYKVDATSLEGFNRQAVNALGVFSANARLNDNGDVEVQCVMRVKHATVPLPAWPMLRDLHDAGSKFADASIVLTKQ